MRRVHRKRSVITESWHDHHQWWSRVFEEPDLQPLSQLWAESSEEELAQAEVELKKLQKLLPPLSKEARHALSAPDALAAIEKGSKLTAS
ncbi:hypothetical protein [Pseudomonas sp. JS425]|uniref:hypothetical protein n=1 Tax=Pseudomonas sp. JS425 TaxID=2829498 RepID=UPI001BAE6C56|nr:hypothetical protein [Pseudomonas sp. JS425]QUN70405.1 hypothetical protein KDB76_14535 [Pseudomonas sp. JS425]